MDFILRLVRPHVLLFLVPIIVLAAWYVRNYYKRPQYIYSLGQVLNNAATQPTWHSLFFFIIRLLICGLLALIVARPQVINRAQSVTVQGRDIMLVTDVSGSMDGFDDMADRRSRLQVAKQEALTFIKKREYDHIGLIIFAKDVLMRCPLTLDKNMLGSLIQELRCGLIDPDGTVLAKGLALACLKLKNSEAKSKVVILLTDGQSTPVDIDPEIALDMARTQGIKVYTIGIGNPDGVLVQHPFYGVVRVQQQGLNKPLLQKIAQRTGGSFFEAQNPHELNKIYAQIDELETTDRLMPDFNADYDWYIPLIWVACALVAIETICSTYVWFYL